jgi:hypothetical protein
MTHFETALSFHAQHDFENALAHYALALREHPRDFQILSNRGAALQKLRRFEQALQSYDQALQLTQAHAAIYNNRGVTLKDLHRLDDALASYGHALQLNPNYVEAWVNRGFVHHLRQAFDLAIADYQTAIALDATFPAAHFNLSLSQLAQGNYPEGWRNYEWRWDAVPSMPRREFSDGKPTRLGHEDIRGKTVLLYAEQGLGDTLQFCRYVPQVKALGAQIILQAPQALHGVLRQLPGVDELIDLTQTPPHFELQCPLMSLPLALGTTLSNIPSPNAYLQADANKALAWKNRLASFKRPRIGCVWSGGFRPDQPELWELNTRRNLPLKQLQNFCAVDADFFSLQKGEPAQSELLHACQHGWSGPVLHDFVDELHDFSDTAALIANLDLVISVDTSTAHLAAALGKPTWILNRFDACWRWLTHRSDSPWYDSVRLYRQHADGDWPALMSLVSADLLRFVDNQPSS